MLDKKRRRRSGQAIIAGYLRHPQTNAEVVAAETNLRNLIADEAW
jgi:hypothetical protein